MLMPLYMGFASVSAPLWRHVLKKRLRRGKEDPARLEEKFGRTNIPRPDGKLFWLHALSVGESLALLTMIRDLGEILPDAHFLLTTSTVTSAAALKRVGLPPRTVHQFAPVDARGPVERFLDHWQPDVACVAETDLWPYLLQKTARRGVPLLLVNACVTDHSFPRRMKLRSLYAAVLPLFSEILAQDKVSADRFEALGAPAANIRVTGPLKTAANPLPDQPEERAKLAEMIGNRPVWLAASTHPQEEEALFCAHDTLRKSHPGLLMIIAPRHVGLADDTEALARKYFHEVARRSNGDKIAAGTAVYIADSFGEMGLWYRLAPLVFSGHSLLVDGPPLGGKNPVEALVLGALVLHGPDVAGLRAIYEPLQAAGATFEVADTPALARALEMLITRPDQATPYKTAAQSFIAAGRSALLETIETLGKAAS